MRIISQLYPTCSIANGLSSIPGCIKRIAWKVSYCYIHIIVIVRPDSSLCGSVDVVGHLEIIFRGEGKLDSILVVQTEEELWWIAAGFDVFDCS
jgi:hypothetical protein